MRKSTATFALLLSACHPSSVTVTASVPSSPLAPNSGATVRINDELSVREVAPHTFVVTHDALWNANVLVAQMPDQSVIIASSPADTVSTRALLDWIDRALAPRQVTAVNTHFHLDGTGGNEAYRERGVITYASDHTQRLFADHGARMRASVAAELADRPALAQRVAETRNVPAEHTFSETDGLSLQLGGEEVRVLFPGAAHAPDNVVVYLPARRVLFGGCMVRAADSIGNLDSADLAHWPEAIEVLQRLSPRVVVAGHGSADGDLLDHTLDVVRKAQSAAP